ncbi:MAG: hypothetical protein F6K00_03450 [Leptolyngbya sp. SIOISBB]|nr:hypothetical protein [Leptolyngbya sp. SIOISBB]
MRIKRGAIVSEELTPAEQQELENLNAVIQKAIADGVLTEAERNEITAAMKADGQITFEELDMVRQLVSDKVASGELKTDH